MMLFKIFERPKKSKTKLELHTLQYSAWTYVCTYMQEIKN